MSDQHDSGTGQTEYSIEEPDNPVQIIVEWAEVWWEANTFWKFGLVLYGMFFIPMGMGFWVWHKFKQGFRMTRSII